MFKSKFSEWSYCRKEERKIPRRSIDRVASPRNVPSVCWVLENNFRWYGLTAQEFPGCHWCLCKYRVSPWPPQTQYRELKPEGEARTAPSLKTEGHCCRRSASVYARFDESVCHFCFLSTFPVPILLLPLKPCLPKWAVPSPPGGHKPLSLGVTPLSRGRATETSVFCRYNTNKPKNKST